MRRSRVHILPSREESSHGCASKTLLFRRMKAPKVRQPDGVRVRAFDTLRARIFPRHDDCAQGHRDATDEQTCLVFPRRLTLRHLIRKNALRQAERTNARESRLLPRDKGLGAAVVQKRKPFILLHSYCTALSNRCKRLIHRRLGMERVKGIEPSYAAWEAAVLPLNYTRKEEGRWSIQRPLKMTGVWRECQ